jgi:hypothetical protein
MVALDHPHLARRNINLGRGDAAGHRGALDFHCRIIQSTIEESSKKFTAASLGSTA